MHAIHVISKLNLTVENFTSDRQVFVYFSRIPLWHVHVQTKTVWDEIITRLPAYKPCKTHGIAQKTTDHLLRLFNASNSTEFIPTCLIKSLVVSNAVCSSSSCSRVIVTTASAGPFLLLLEAPPLSLSELAPLKASAFMPSSSARAVNCESAVLTRLLSSPSLSSTV